jgi:hypothetical protein
MAEIDRLYLLIALCFIAAMTLAFALGILIGRMR